MSSTENREVFTRSAAEPTEIISYGSDADQVLDMYGSNGPVVALVHGGFWRPEYNRLHTRPTAAALAQSLDARVANIEYRRIPGDPDASVRDVIAAVHYLATAHGAPILLVGHSAGGHLALCAYAQAPLVTHGVVALAPVSDLALAAELDLDQGAVVDFLGCPAQDRPDLDPQQLAPPRRELDNTASASGITVIHGELDMRVPLYMSRTFAGDHLVELAGVGHFELIDPDSSAFTVVLEAVRHRLTHG
ncbi:MAG: alpha/beta hydrolase [Candidatus Nanopelagicales bacterium]|nr:alpha/beta hydrolase [Candidatus Nanopelagicales bacterium]